MLRLFLFPARKSEHQSSMRFHSQKSETGPRARISQKVWCATPKRPPPAIAVQGLEPDDRNRFGMLPNPCQLSLPSRSSRRSTQLKATSMLPAPCQFSLPSSSSRRSTQLKATGVLPHLGQLSLPSSLSRRSAQLKATQRRKRWPRPGRARRRPKMKMRFQDESRL